MSGDVHGDTFTSLGEVPRGEKQSDGSSGVVMGQYVYSDDGTWRESGSHGEGGGPRLDRNEVLIHFGRFSENTSKGRAMAGVMSAVGHAPGAGTASTGESEKEGTKMGMKLFNSMLNSLFKSSMETGAGKLAAPRPDDLPSDWYMIHPYSAFRQFWDLLQILLLMYAAVLIPFRTGFLLPAMGGWFVFEGLMDIAFMMDLALNFVTGYEDPMKNLVMHPGMVRDNYLHSRYFWVDLVSCIPVDTILRAAAGHFGCSVYDTCPQSVWDENSGNSGAQITKMFRVIKVFRLAKLLKLPQAQRAMDKYMDDFIMFLPFFSVIKLTLATLYVAHIVACGFFFFSLNMFRSDFELDEIDSGFTYTWFMQEFGTTTPERRYQYKVDGTLAYATTRQYIASMHWAFQTMTTVGYGDIPVTSNSERIWAMFGMVVGCIVFSIFMSYVASAIERIKRADKVMNDRLDAVVDFIRANPLPLEHRRMLLRHSRLQSMAPANEAEFLMQLPFSLRSSIVQHLYSGRLEKVLLFDSCSKVLLTELATCIQPAYCVRGDNVYTRDEFANHIYIITEGCVALTAPNHLLRPSFLRTRGLADIQEGDVSLVPQEADASGGEEDAHDVTFMLVGENSYFGEGATLLLGQRAENALARLNTSLSMIPVGRFREVVDHAEEVYAKIRRDHLKNYDWVFRDMFTDSSGGRYTWSEKHHGYMRSGEASVASIPPSRAPGRVISLTNMLDAQVRSYADLRVPPEQNSGGHVIHSHVRLLKERIDALELDNAALREAVDRVDRGNKEVLDEVRQGFALMGEGFAMALAGRPLSEIGRAPS